MIFYGNMQFNTLAVTRTLDYTIVYNIVHCATILVHIVFIMCSAVANRMYSGLCN